MPAAPAAPPTESAPAAPAPAAKPDSGPFVPPPRPPASERFADEFAEFDRVAAGDTAKPDPKPTEKKAEKPAKPVEKPAEKVEKAVEKSEEKVAEPVDPKEPNVDPAEAVETPDKKFQTAREVREWGQSLHRENVALKKQMEELKNAKPKDDPTKTYQEKLAEMEKRQQQLQEELKFTNYERSDEYKQQYMVPLHKAYQAAFNDLAEITVEADDGTTRKATEDDFRVVTQLPLGLAKAKARELFGDLAEDVMAHRRRVIELNEARKEALETYKTKGVEREQQTAAQREAARKARQELFEASIKEAPEKFPEYFAPIEGDDEGNALLESGNKLADMAFKGAQGLSEEALVKAHAEVRLRAGAFSREVLKNKRLKERVAALEEELKAFKASEPTGGDTGRDETARELSVEEEIDAIAAGRKAA
jgi:hypothetical protein